MSEYFKVLLVGSSGKGKTFSFRNMNPETTGILNIENKPLPFKGKFPYHERPNHYVDAYTALDAMGKNDKIKDIVIDSFSAYTDLLLSEARRTKKGFDIWSMYNEGLGKFLDLIKKVPKNIFVTAHYEILGIEGNMEKRVKVKAKEWEGQIEKEFTVVLYADSKMDAKSGKPEYWYNLFQEGTSAKCPPDLFGDTFKIPNDAKLMVDSINKFTEVTV